MSSLKSKMSVLFLLCLASLFFPKIAVANTVPSASINCERITIQYADFPQEPVAIEVIVKWNGANTVVPNIKTTGISGTTVIPLDLQGEGVAKLDLDWVVGTKHAFDSKTKLTCVLPETTTTTNPPTTTSTEPATTTTTIVSTPPTSTPKPNPGELPKTGAGSDMLIILGAGMVVFGIIIARRT